MANEASEIPLVGRLEDTGLQLLVTKTPGGPIDEWRLGFASNLDLESDGSRMNHWNHLHSNLPASRRLPSGKTSDRPRAGTPARWSRLNIAYKRWITVVRLVNRTLVDQRISRNWAATSWT